MSITLQNNPGAYYSANGDLIFVVIDVAKSATYSDYRYVCDVYIGGSLVTRLKAFPHPDSKMGVFSVGNIIRDYIAASFSPVVSVLRSQELGSGQFYIAAQMKFGDEYNLVLNTDLLVDSNRTYFGHYNGRLIGNNTNLSAYAGAPATTRPTATPVNEDSNFNFVPYFPVDVGLVPIVIKSYTASGTLLKTYNTSITPTLAYNMQILNLSPVNLAALSPGLIVPGLTSYYTVEFTGTIVGGSFRIANINPPCVGGTTLYRRVAFGVGARMYTDAAATIPLTGYTYISDFSIIYNIDTLTGVVGALVGVDAC